MVHTHGIKAQYYPWGLILLGRIDKSFWESPEPKESSWPYGPLLGKTLFTRIGKKELLLHRGYSLMGPPLVPGIPPFRLDSDFDDDGLSRFSKNAFYC